MMMGGDFMPGEGELFVDLVLAIAHHLLIFILAATLAAEFVLVRPGLAGRELKLVAHIDQAYGGIAGAIIIVGVLRVIFGLKGWEFYVYNWAFWAKMAAFVATGLLSVPPTARILAWKKAAQSSTGLYAVPDNEIAAVRRYLRWGVAIFLLIPVFAAIMARGIGI
jgi:putative membrane protein